jgi:hypothetical protein
MRKFLVITALILAGSFGVTACHNSSSAPSPGPTSPVSSVYPASAQNSIVSDCEQNNGEPASYCQCNLSWLEANIPYSMFAQAPATFEQQADAYASC